MSTDRGSQPCAEQNILEIDRYSLFFFINMAARSAQSALLMFAARSIQLCLNVFEFFHEPVRALRGEK